MQVLLRTVPGQNAVRANVIETKVRALLLGRTFRFYQFASGERDKHTFVQRGRTEEEEGQEFLSRCVFLVPGLNIQLLKLTSRRYSRFSMQVPLVFRCTMSRPGF